MHSESTLQQECWQSHWALPSSGGYKGGHTQQVQAIVEFATKSNTWTSARQAVESSA